MHSQKLAVIILLTALSIGTDYAMLFLYNVKLMDLIVFIGGFCFGPFVGAFIGVISWVVYGILNPMGFSLPIWLSTMFSETIYGIAGGIVRKNLNPKALGEFKDGQVNIYFFFGILGMFLTFTYDLITNIVFGCVSGWSIPFAVIVGFLPFGLIHMLSNAFFFGLGCVPAINAISKVMGGENSGFPKE